MSGPIAAHLVQIVGFGYVFDSIGLPAQGPVAWARCMHDVHFLYQEHAVTRCCGGGCGDRQGNVTGNCPKMAWLPWQL